MLTTGFSCTRSVPHQSISAVPGQLDLVRTLCARHCHISRKMKWGSMFDTVFCGTPPVRSLSGGGSLGSAADLEDPARSGPVERMSAPAEFHRSGVVVHCQQFCAPSGLWCEPEAALDPPTLQRRCGMCAVRASTGTFCDTNGTMVLRGACKHLGGVRFRGQWFRSSGSNVTKAPAATCEDREWLACAPGYLTIRMHTAFFGVSWEYCADTRSFKRRSCGGNREQNPLRLALHAGDRDAPADPCTKGGNRNSNRDGAIVHRGRQQRSE